MSESVFTRPSLLVRPRDPCDGSAWREFVALYAPVIYRFARRQGLQDADAADLTQDVLQAVNGAIERFDYDPDRGTFRGWLFTLVHRRMCDWLRRQKHQPAGSGDTGLREQLEAVSASQTDVWEDEYRRRLLALAAEKARTIFAEVTWQAFKRTALLGREPAEVAQELGLSLGAVYVARSRVQAKLKKLVQQAQAEE